MHYINLHFTSLTHPANSKHIQRLMPQPCRLSCADDEMTTMFRWNIMTKIIQFIIIAIHCDRPVSTCATTSPHIGLTVPPKLGHVDIGIMLVRLFDVYGHVTSYVRHSRHLNKSDIYLRQCNDVTL